MKKVFHLNSCSTCIRIIKAIDWPKDVIFQNIKLDSISSKDLDEIRNMTDSYDSIFSKRSMKYKSRNLKEKNLTENDIRALIFEEYTFLKRPVVVYNDQLFIGNSKKNVEKMISFFGGTIDKK